MKWIPSVAVSCFLLFASCAFAQELSTRLGVASGAAWVGWAKIGGSSVSSGGAYSVSGSIGPAVTGVVSGGNYTLGKSYWGIIAGVQSPGVPLLVITAAAHLLDGDFQLTFSGNLGQTYMLQSSTNLTNWVTVLTFTCTNSPMVVVDPGAGSYPYQFYRIAQ